MPKLSRVGDANQAGGKIMKGAGSQLSPTYKCSADKTQEQDFSILKKTDIDLVPADSQFQAWASPTASQGQEAEQALPL